MDEHPYDELVRVLKEAPGASSNYPDMNEVVANRMFRLAIEKVVKMDEYFVTDARGLPYMADPDDTGGLRLDVWVPVKDGWVFAFRIDKDIPYSVEFLECIGDLVGATIIRTWAV